MSSVTRSLALAGLLAPTVLLAGCGASGDEAGTGRQAVAAFYPLAWVTEQVAGDDWQVTNLTAPGTEAHDLTLDIAQTAEIEQADLVVLQHDFQPAVERTVEQNAGDAEIVEVSEAVELVPVEDHGLEHEEHADEEHADEEHSDEEHSDEEHSDEEHSDEDAHDGHDHGDLDPHFWLDPLLMADLADAVADRVGDIDPDNATEYAERADALRSELEQLDQDYSNGLARCERDVAVVSHDAFGYLSRYGLDFEAIAGLSPDAEPTPAHLAELQQLIREEGVTTVFSERLASAKMAETLSSDLGIETAVLDPIEGLSEETAQEDYVSLMQSNLEALRTANGCR